MRPLIKWPGGKSHEFVHIEESIPPFNRYIEPFFGGGAVFCKIEPKRAIINDICKELICFYRFVKGEYDRESFKKELYEYVINWEKVPVYIKLFENKLINVYLKYRSDKIDITNVKDSINDCIEGKEKKFNGLFVNSFCLDRKNLMQQVINNLISKMQRTKEIEQTRGELPFDDVHKNIEAAFRSGFYMHFRDVMNFDGNKYNVPLAKKIANYYFIREFCYGAMFRFNSQGQFNIPYGGIAYNKKDFRGKVDYMFSNEVKKTLEGIEIKDQDFEIFLNSLDFNKDDFIFLDPPYDSDFSDYENQCFDKNDQTRLANILYKAKAKFILIIKNTPFIYGLYGNKKNIKINTFKKRYLYNIKGRNNRTVEHLVISNF